MDKEVIEFFANKGREVGKLVRLRPHKITPMQIHRACERLFGEIKKGKQVKDILLTPTVYALAEQIDAEDYQDNMDKVNDLAIQLEEKKQEIDEVANKYAFELAELEVRSLVYKDDARKSRNFHMVVESVVGTVLAIYLILQYLGII